jgi:lysophospholipase L1-like esterase
VSSASAVAAVFVLAGASLASGGDTTQPRPRSLKLIAIGDSLPYGQNDCNHCSTFVQRFGKALAGATHRGVLIRNLSEHTGIDSGDLRHQLRSSRSLRRAVAGADAITITIGHNDTPWNSDHDVCDGAAVYPHVNWTSYSKGCAQANANAYGTNLNAILKTVRALRQHKRTLIRVTNDYNDIIGDPVVPASATTPSKLVVEAQAAKTCALAVKYRAICIDTYHAFNGPHGLRDAGPLLAGDHTHPNAAGHRLIARLLIAAGFKPLTRR